MYLDLLRIFILLHTKHDNRWFSECIIFTQIYYSNQNQRAKALVVCMCSNSLAPCWDLPMTKMVAMQGFFIGCHIIIICSYIFLITSLQLNKMLCMYRTKSFDVHSLSLVQLLYNFQATLFKKHFYCWPAKLMMGYAHCLQWTICLCVSRFEHA